MIKIEFKKLFTTLSVLLSVFGYCSGSSITVPEYICYGRSANYSASIDESSPSNYNWTIVSGTYQGSPTSNTTTFSVIWTSGSTQVKLTYDYVDGNGVTQHAVLFGTVQIVSDEQLTPITVSISASPSNIICPGQSTTLFANASGGSTSPTYDYMWSHNNETTSSISVSPTSNSSYTVSVVDQCGHYGESSPFNVTVNPAPDFGVTSTATGKICPQSTATLTATPTVPGSSYTYSWSPASSLDHNNVSSVIATPLTPTTYTVTATNTYGCTKSLPIFVDVFPRATVQVAKSEILACGNPGSFTLSASGAYSYTWAPATGLNATTGATVTGTITPAASPMIYTVTAKNNDGCTTTSASTNVTVTDGPPKAETVYGPSDNVNGPATPAYLCINPSDQMFWVSTVNNIPSQTSYYWYFNNTGNASLSNYSGYGVTSVFAHFNTGFTGGITLQVQATNACGSAVIGGIFTEVDGTVPSTPNIGTGPSSACNSGANSTFNLNYMTSTASYEFTPSNAVANSTINQYGQISVDWNNSFVGTVSIRARTQNGCGYSGWSPYKNVTISNGTCRIGAMDEDNNTSADGWAASIYPNPAQQGANLNITNDFSSFATVEVSDATGKTIYTNKEVSTGSEFTIGDNFPTGIYIVKVSCGGSQKFLKFIKN